ncbi:MAG: Zn-dependent oxidoreductase [Actinomycetia bacterium]|nr:Zn-dependent oxidoreductase [Actinomycetes bacterium]
MRAVRVLENGAPKDVVTVQDVPVPEVGPGMVLVKVGAAPINFGDIARCRGGVASVMNPPPFTLGMDVCGVVESAGEGGEQWIGTRVVAMCQMSFGGMAEYALCPVNGIFEAPEELDDVEAAAFTLPFHTSYLAVHERAKVQPGDFMLVVGGATAVGTAAIQLGVAAGARVIAVAGGTEKGALCRQLGAELAIDHTADDIFDRVMAHTGEHGVDVCIDMIGGAGTEVIWTCMAWEGRYVPVGFNDDPGSGMTGKPLRKVSMGNFSVHGVMLSYNQAPLAMRKFGVQPNPPDLGPKVHAALCDLVAKGSIKPVVGRRIGMGEVAQALDDHEHRRTSGRTVVDVTVA